MDVSPNFAETEGFEPSRGLLPCLVSSEVPSTAQPRLQILLPTKFIVLRVDGIGTEVSFTFGPLDHVSFLLFRTKLPYHI